VAVNVDPFIAIASFPFYKPYYCIQYIVVIDDTMRMLQALVPVSDL
jgi:hypothetical protein